MKTQDFLFWLINIYLFFEYVRPQTIYPSLDFLPFTQLVILTTLIFIFIKRDIVHVNNTINILMFIFFVVILLSCFFAINSIVAFDRIGEIIAWYIIYFLITRIINTEDRFLIFMLGFLLYSFKMAQFSFRGWGGMGFGYSSWGSGGGPGWFQNSGEFGVQMCVFLPLSFYFIIALRQYWPKWKTFFFTLFPLFAISGTISSSSRGALLGAIAVMVWILFKSRYKIKGLLILCAVAVIALQFVPPEQIARFESAGKEDDRTSQTRLERWEKGIDMANRYPLFGVGYANWGVADRVLYGGGGGLSHNIFIECVSELGYSGLCVFILLIFATFFNNYQTRKKALSKISNNQFVYYMAHGLDGALIGYLVSGFFVTVLYYPYFWINLSFSVALNNIARNLK